MQNKPARSPSKALNFDLRLSFLPPTIHRTNVNGYYPPTDLDNDYLLRDSQLTDMAGGTAGFIAAFAFLVDRMDAAGLRPALALPADAGDAVSA